VTAATYALIALAAIAWLVHVARVALVAARMLQVEEYESLRFLRWGVTQAWLLHRSVLLAVVISLAALLLALFAHDQASRVVAAGWLTASLSAAVVWRWIPPKKPLVLTARMRRILAAAGVLASLPAVAAALLLVRGRWLAAGVLVLVLVGLTTALSQALLVGANLFLTPVEAFVRRHYLRLARDKMRALSPLVVAIAGSYGKTSTKHILAALLVPSVETLPTRRSFNTLMGVSKVINEDLAPQHRVFLVEMDAYGPGEIAAISDLVRPRIAVLTAVGPQHLERFGSVQRIADALYEVIASLPPDGVAVMHAGEDTIGQLCERASGEGRNVVRYGMNAATSSGTRPVDDSQKPCLDVIAEDVRLHREGATFRWSWPARGLARDVSIPLLGRHQVLNVTAAMSVVAILGHDLDAAVAAAQSLEPVEHRLQPVSAAGPITVIDDSYNANPVGVHNGLDVLATMDGGRKILVTPGLVELGSVEYQENRRYGEHAASVCSDVIVMDARPARALREGLLAGGLDESHIHTARSLDEATAIISRVGRPGDVVLFANDLPDTYLSTK
jgi:UDP-N-acetylmuramoyl-tripeptide--D-alanyl-D-alanine ligase